MVLQIGSLYFLVQNTRIRQNTQTFSQQNSLKSYLFKYNHLPFSLLFSFLYTTDQCRLIPYRPHTRAFTPRSQWGRGFPEAKSPCLSFWHSRVLLLAMATGCLWQQELCVGIQPEERAFFSVACETLEVVGQRGWGKLSQRKYWVVTVECQE